MISVNSPRIFGTNVFSASLLEISLIVESLLWDASARLRNIPPLYSTRNCYFLNFIARLFKENSLRDSASLMFATITLPFKVFDCARLSTPDLKLGHGLEQGIWHDPRQCCLWGRSSRWHRGRDCKTAPTWFWRYPVKYLTEDTCRFRQE